jgi:hypothetical protein
MSSKPKRTAWRRIIEFPLKYDREGGWLVDNSGHPVLQMRGYGKLSSILQPIPRANDEQDDFTQWAARVLNKAMTSEKQGGGYIPTNSGEMSNPPKRR